MRQDIRRLGVLVEHIDDNVKLVAEQYGDINQKIDNLGQKVDKVEKTLDGHTEMIGKLAVDTAIIKEDIEFIKNSLKKKVDIDEFSALERRVALLEKHL